MYAEHIIRRPILLTEKATRLREDLNQVVFEVAPKANKIQIKSAVETLFNVGVEAVRTQIVRGKSRRMGRGHGQLRTWKKAIVTLEPGSSIRFYEEEAQQ